MNNNTKREEEKKEIKKLIESMILLDKSLMEEHQFPFKSPGFYILTGKKVVYERLLAEYPLEFDTLTRNPDIKKYLDDTPTPPTPSSEDEGKEELCKRCGLPYGKFMRHIACRLVEKAEKDIMFDTNDIQINPHKKGTEGKKEESFEEIGRQIDEDIRTYKGKTKDPHTDRSDWEEELIFGVLEDYLYLAKMEHLARDRKTHMEKMRAQYGKLKSFIKTLLREKEEELGKRICRALDGIKDFHRFSDWNEAIDEAIKVVKREAKLEE